MTKLELIKEISEKTGINRGQVEATIEAFMSSVKDNIVHNEPIYLRGFGNFMLRKRGAKIARNISKNIAMPLPERYIPVFKPSKKFSRKIKNVPEPAAQ
jgi:DNA-binding protein HU-beta